MFCMFCILSRFNRDRAGTIRSLPEGVPYNKSALQILRDDIQVGENWLTRDMTQTHKSEGGRNFQTHFFKIPLAVWTPAPNIMRNISRVRLWCCVKGWTKSVPAATTHSETTAPETLNINMVGTK